jgi:hypothetical protein
MAEPAAAVASALLWHGLRGRGRGASRASINKHAGRKPSPSFSALAPTKCVCVCVLWCRDRVQEPAQPRRKYTLMLSHRPKLRAPLRPPVFASLYVPHYPLGWL